MTNPNHIYQVWVREDPRATGDLPSGANMYVHHEVMLPAFPLCAAWLDCRADGGAGQANYAAVGTLEPGIEIWDLDLVSSLHHFDSVNMGPRPG